MILADPESSCGPQKRGNGWLSSVQWLDRGCPWNKGCQNGPEVSPGHKSDHLLFSVHQQAIGGVFFAATCSPCSTGALGPVWLVWVCIGYMQELLLGLFPCAVGGWHPTGGCLTKCSSMCSAAPHSFTMSSAFCWLPPRCMLAAGMCLLGLQTCSLLGGKPHAQPLAPSCIAASCGGHGAFQMSMTVLECSCSVRSARLGCQVRVLGQPGYDCTYR